MTAFQALLLELYESIGNKVKFLNFALTRQLRDVPTASQSLNQRYTGNEPILLDRQSSLLFGQQCRLGGNNRGIWNNAGLVLFQGNLDGSLSRPHCTPPPPPLLPYNSYT